MRSRFRRSYATERAAARDPPFSRIVHPSRLAGDRMSKIVVIVAAAGTVFENPSPTSMICSCSVIFHVSRQRDPLRVVCQKLYHDMRRGRFRCGWSDRDNDFPSRTSVLDVPDGGGDLTQWKPPVNRRSDLPRFAEFLQKQQVSLGGLHQQVS